MTCEVVQSPLNNEQTKEKLLLIRRLTIDLDVK